MVTKALLWNAHIQQSNSWNRQLQHYYYAPRCMCRQWDFAPNRTRKDVKQGHYIKGNSSRGIKSENKDHIERLI